MDYQRISCTLFDRIENLAVLKKKVKITYLNEKNIFDFQNGIITNILSENNSEFLSINNIKIRLDKIQSIKEF